MAGGHRTIWRSCSRMKSACIASGEVAERFKAHAWKACVGETLPGVRIPPLRQSFQPLISINAQFCAHNHSSAREVRGDGCRAQVCIPCHESEVCPQARLASYRFHGWMCRWALMSSLAGGWMASQCALGSLVSTISFLSMTTSTIPGMSNSPFTKPSSFAGISRRL